MSKHTFTQLGFYSLLTLAAPITLATGNIGGVVGHKWLGDDWSHHDEQDSIGILLDIRPQSWPVSLAFDVFGTGHEKDDGPVGVTDYTAEAHIGLRKYCDLSEGLFTPYIGGGLALVYAEEEVRTDSTVKYEDRGAGVWLGTGVQVNLSRQFKMGVDVRYSYAEVNLAGDDRNGGGINAGISLGYHW
ncbi:outer membrane beta-barrel protein [Gynuella sunshinyii]|uniref:Opacity protein-related surface antigen n=1 Tax=Gynuella sunshinyii YC6258 TaxID=1445510 RepID=A0A0C5W2X0_9GAMM|nr:outer membrane beta-barrel protein [Gynuella sunshinyii]AJQ97014.1 opacity protein-related surface antigen [Gynuella sunshinyii YC6258]